jgi:hypothetical protein
MITQQGNEWLENSVLPGGYFELNAGCEVIFHSVHEAIHKLGLQYTHDRLITKLTFGCWTYLFAAKEYAAAGSTLLAIFPNRPFGTKQKTVFQSLLNINELRNRIAHHEPVCFDGDNISTARTERRYRLMLELFDWLGCSTEQMLSGIDKINVALDTIYNI